jgi:hypothetical protein
VEITPLAFGGLGATTPVSENLAATQNNGPSTRSLLPIANMNFSNSMSGWVFSRDYKIVRDDGYVTNTFLNIIPGGTVFSLNVTNSDPAVETCANLESCITRVSLQVDSRFNVADYASITQSAAPLGWSVTISGNAITWSISAAGGISGGQGPMTFTWAALAPGVPGTYFQTATVTWLTVFDAVPISDQGSVTVQTVVVTGGPGQVCDIATGCVTQCAAPAPSPSDICAEPADVIPGGAVGGYDGVSNEVGSESGPGSVYVTFQPTYNGVAISEGQQLTAVMNFTSAFTIDAGQAAALEASPNPLVTPDALNFGFSLDSVIAPPNPLILVNAYLVQLKNTGAVNEIIQIPNTTPVVPTQFNNFNSSGWITCGPNSAVCSEPYFNPDTLAIAQGYSGWTWNPGLYELVISVAASMPGANPPSVYYPSSLLMHFDDVGLALQDTPASYYVDNAAAGSACVNPTPPPATLPCGLLEVSLKSFPVSIEPSEVQSITLTTSLALSPGIGQNVTAYVFLGDVSRGTATPVWVEVGQLEMSSSATISVTIPSSTASNFIDTTGNICGAPLQKPELCVRVYAVSDYSYVNGVLGANPDFLSLSASAYAVVQTYQQNVVTLTLLNNSTFPVAFSNIYISGPDGVTGYQLVPNSFGPSYCGEEPFVSGSQTTPCYIDQGQSFAVELPFAWQIDQTYTVSVVTNKGLEFSSTLVSP